MTGAVDESDGDPNQAKSYLLMDWLRELSDQDLRAWIEYCEDHRAHLKSTDPRGGWFRSNHISAAYKVIDERRAQGSVVDRPEIEASTPVMTVETYHPTESGWTRDRRVVPKPSGPANDSEPIWMPGGERMDISCEQCAGVDKDAISSLQPHETLGSRFQWVTDATGRSYLYCVACQRVAVEQDWLASDQRPDRGCLVDRGTWGWPPG